MMVSRYDEVGFDNIRFFRDLASWSKQVMVSMIVPRYDEVGFDNVRFFRDVKSRSNQVVGSLR